MKYKVKMIHKGSAYMLKSKGLEYDAVFRNEMDAEVAAQKTVRELAAEEYIDITDEDALADKARRAYFPDNEPTYEIIEITDDV